MPERIVSTRPGDICRWLCLWSQKQPTGSRCANTMRYQVRVVEDHQLPPPSHWVIVTTRAETLLFLKRSQLQDPLALAGLLSNAWAAWQEYEDRFPVAV